MTTTTRRILITNDDGIDAPGLAALRAAAQAFGEVYVVAPAREWSGCGHRVTTDSPIAVIARGEREFVVDGTPADCVRLALDRLTPGIDVVLSGVNAGGNLGVDVFYSGTVAAAREASFHGVLGIAISHYLARGVPLDWPRAIEWVAGVLPQLLARRGSRLLNVNLPHPEVAHEAPALAWVPLDPSPLPIRFESEGDGEAYRYRGDYHARILAPGHDVATCFGGLISATEL
jgi:5'-nucleotidase